MQVLILLLLMLVLCLTVESGVHRRVLNDDDASSSEADGAESERQVQFFNCPSCGPLHLPCCSPKVCRRPILSLFDKCVWIFGKWKLSWPLVMVHFQIVHLNSTFFYFVVSLLLYSSLLLQYISHDGEWICWSKQWKTFLCAFSLSLSLFFLCFRCSIV